MTKKSRDMKYDRVKINEAPFGVSSSAGGLIGLTPEGGDGRTVVYTLEALEEMLRSGEADLQRDYFNPERAVCDHESPVAYLRDLNRELQLLTLWRNDYVDLYEQFAKEGKLVCTAQSVKAALPQIKGMVDAREALRQSSVEKPKRAGEKTYNRKAPSASTLLAWKRRRACSGGDPRSLIPKTHMSGNRRNRFSAALEKIIAEGVRYYASVQRPSRKLTARKIRTNINKTNQTRIEDGLRPFEVPSNRTILRRLDKLDPYSTYAARYGASAANRKFGAYEQGVKVSFPMERIEIDEWNVDALNLLDEMGILDGISEGDRKALETTRLWLYLAIDCATRCVVGMHLCDTPNGADAVRLLSLVTRDKTDLALAAGCESAWHQGGGLGQVAADLGPAFVDQWFHTAVYDLGGSIGQPPGDTPRLRARVERIFGTFGTQLMPLLAGRTFSNPIERGDYDSVKLAAHTRDSLMRILTIHVVDIYHNTPHRGLKGETPANCWERLTSTVGTLPYPSAIQRTAAFGIEVEREVTGKGVLVCGIDYVCDFLREHHKRIADEKARIRINPENLGWVMVWTGKAWVQARAIQTCFDGVSLGKWRAASRELGLKHAQQAQLTEGVVERAFQRVEDINAEQIAKFNVQIPFMTKDDLLREERQLHRGLTIKTTEQVPLDLPKSPDTLGSDIPFTYREPDLFTPPPSENPEATRRKGASVDKPLWGMEDDE